MKTTFEVQQAISPLDEKVILERFQFGMNIWNASVNPENRLISFEYLNRNVLETVRRELGEMGYHVINNTHELDKNRKP
ncbi:hypothetical protein [Maribacter sp. HTCC2170]|uniref:hypothetical protein n=1 Tax=Maribacter sp. (strain HTCC2170 / KCCM 42371) TaxID=313603 RepID=UPI00006B218C|nr:hypothetical protein [Maribacter sp. HTCC2170]EAR00096.1 hypothetical protein FB2170_00480 [Maribacter sp. HTCC2170]